MTDKQIIIDGLFCDNCPEAQRCQEQRAKKEYAINQVLQDVPSEYANVINRLKQIIPSITRCDYVLEKQLKHKEQECKRLKWYMQEIRMQELSHLDIEWDEYETHSIDTEYTNIINLVEEALEEISPEDCTYKKDK